MLSIVIPAYNEEKRLPGSIEKIEDYLRDNNIDAEVIIVIEKSEDRTLAVARHYQQVYPNIRLIKNDRRYGKGYSVRRGVAEARGELIMFVDSDLSVPIAEMEKFAPFVGQYECFIGERIQIKKQPLYRRIMGLCFRHLNFCLTGLRYRDTQCGFKMFTRKFAGIVFAEMVIDGFSFDVEMLMLAKTLGLNVKSVRVEWYNDKESKVSPVIDSCKMIRDLIKIKSNLKRRETSEFSIPAINQR